MAYVNTTLAPSFADRIRSILQTLKTRRTQNRRKTACIVRP
jgi:hypothetical protein